jgi:hypothetical protein
VSSAAKKSSFSFHDRIRQLFNKVPLVEDYSLGQGEKSWRRPEKFMNRLPNFFGTFSEISPGF